MLVNIEELKKCMDISDPEEQHNRLLQLLLEAMANSMDNNVTNKLLAEIVSRNALLNNQLQEHLEEIQRLSATDHLTGLFNRRRFVEVLQREIDRKSRYASSFSIIMFDIDHFKQINDTFGHDVGDQVLVNLSSVIGQRLRQSDFFARWGGEEFMILLTETSKEDALFIAESLRKLVESSDFTPVDQVTCCFGIITSDENDRSPLDMLTKFVDQALYHAKKTGRNKVVCYLDMVH